MKSFHQLTRSVIVVALVAGSVASVSAAGVVGKRTVQATYNFTNYDSSAFKSSGGYTVFLNMPIKQGLFDVGFDYTQYDQDSNVTGQPDRSRNQALAMATLYSVDHGQRPYLRLGLGNAEWEYQPDDIRDGFAYFAEAGIEFVYNERIRATPFVSWVDSFESRTRGDLHYGLRGDFSVSENISVLVGIWGDENRNFTGSIGAGFSF